MKTCRATAARLDETMPSFPRMRDFADTTFDSRAPFMRAVRRVSHALVPDTGERARFQSG